MEAMQGVVLKFVAVSQGFSVHAEGMFGPQKGRTIAYVKNILCLLCLHETTVINLQ